MNPNLARNSLKVKETLDRPLKNVHNMLYTRMQWAINPVYDQTTQTFPMIVRIQEMSLLVSFPRNYSFRFDYETPTPP